MSIADFQEQVQYAHTVSELNSLMMQWSVLEGSDQEKRAAFEELCQRREQMIEPAERGHDYAVRPLEAFESRL